ncbi:hypothetical protein [Marinirhabdus gelatinilytica]|uniref:Lipoprotein n=1 Tax=Marinirhabdus gelatinilytica TaxID=1703343 RepID=A0A370QIZ8_9FLAO|nr:hypothetical protein [Marinirhabdus gelatinilytica]RDK88309.1 hypothetical protein C8D94_101179 [Marinirhabdus gelatinilytica]
MKKLLTLSLVLATLFACENPVSKKIKEAKDGVSNTVKATKELNKMGDDIKELQSVEPLTNEEMKEWLPDEINGMKRTGYKAGQTAYIKIASIEGTYSNEDKSKTFKVNVLDGAGEMGASATAGIRMMLSMDMEEEDENKTKRTVKKGDIKAIEEYRKNNNRTNIQLMYGKRFYIQANGSNMDVDETWDAIDDLDLDDLG